jgi:hypothetical protein
MFSVLFSLTRLHRNSILCSAVTNRVSHPRLFCIYRELFLRPPLVTQTSKLFLDRHPCPRPQFLLLTEQSVVFRLSPVSSASARNPHSTVVFLAFHLLLPPLLTPHTDQQVVFRLSPFSSASARTSHRTVMFLDRHRFLRPQLIPLTEHSVDFRLSPISSTSYLASYRTVSCF